MKSFILFSIIFISFSLSTDYVEEISYSDWKMASSSGDFKVYKRSRSDSKYKEIKIENILNAPVEKVVAAVSNVDDYSKWIYKCAESKKVRGISDNEYIYYTRANLPSPLWDRDIVAHSVYRFEGGTHYFNSKEALGEVDESKKAVRVKQFNASWEIRDLGNDKTSIVNKLHFEPGGRVPAWLVNMSVAKGPKKTMANLKAILSE